MSGIYYCHSPPSPQKCHGYYTLLLIVNSFSGKFFWKTWTHFGSSGLRKYYLQDNQLFMLTDSRLPSTKWLCHRGANPEWPYLRTTGLEYKRHEGWMPMSDLADFPEAWKGASKLHVGLYSSNQEVTRLAPLPRHHTYKVIYAISLDPILGGG